MSQRSSQPKNPTESRPIDVIRTVKQSAMNHWQSLLPACGVDVPAKGEHGACPICGGTNRFHFMDDHGHGDWHCHQCDNPNHGDGFDLLMKAKGITITEAVKAVSDVLALPLPEPARKEAPKSEAPNMQPAIEEATRLIQSSVLGESDYLKRKGLHYPKAIASKFDALCPVL